MKINREPKRTNREVLQLQLQDAHRDMERARRAFDMVLDPDLISACIFDLNAAQSRYSCLLRQLRELETPALQQGC